MIEATRTTPRASPQGRMWRWFLNGAAAAGVVAVVVAVVVAILGGRVVIFTSGSMAPAIPAGSAALTMPQDTAGLRPGEVISVPRAGDGRLVTHRVIEVSTHDGLVLATLQGDANAAPDAAPYALGAQAQRVELAVPGVGSALGFLKSPWVLGATIALILLAAVPTRSRKTDGKRGSVA